MLEKISNLRTVTLAQKESYLPYVDGLRGIAVIMVVVSHTAQHLGTGAFSSQTIQRYVEAGDRGVQLFFILSAFTLYNSSMRRFKVDRYPRLSFYLRRAWRILPLWIGIVIFWTWYGGHTAFQGLVSASFIFGFLRFDSWFEIVPGGWTLFVEETFYFLLPFILFFIVSLKKAGWFFLSLLLLSFTWEFFANRMEWTSNGFVFFAPFSHWLAFGLGIVCYYIAKDTSFKHFMNKEVNIKLIDSLAIVAIFMVIAENYRLATLALFIMCVLAAYRSSIFGIITSNKLLQRFGKYCYSIYLLQFIALIFLDKYNEQLFNLFNAGSTSYEIKLLIALPVVLAGLLVAATATFYLLERPCVNFGKGVVKKVNSTGKRKDDFLTQPMGNTSWPKGQKSADSQIA